MPEDVTPAPSSSVDSAPDSAPAEGSVPGAVIPALPSDRPVENVVAEFNRKFSRMQQQMETLAQYVATQRATPAASPSKGDATDEELWSLAQQGDRGAFDLYMRRIADQTSQQQVRAVELQRGIDTQLGILAQRYPVFNDAAHPLTQHTNAMYAGMVAQGYPANRVTLLEAMKTAIADRPDLVSEIHAKLSPSPLRRERSQAGVTGATTRDVPTAPSSAKPLSKEQVALAQRMGVKDPGKSLERFYKRQEEGKSALGAVASYVKEE